MAKEIKLIERVADVPGVMRPRYPWAVMEVGDWFVVPLTRAQYWSVALSVRDRNRRGAEKFSIKRRDQEGSYVAGFTCSGSIVTRIL